MMLEAGSEAQTAPKIEKLTPWSFIAELIHGISITLGLTLLWSLEGVRNLFFRILDRMNLPARPRRASAFPPGRARNAKAASDRRQDG
jgi:hypothetical protein